MKPEPTNLKQQQHAEQEQSQTHHAQSQAQGQEFATVDELLRYDSEQSPVPPEVAERLGHSLEAEPKQPQPWYKKLFG